MLSVNRNGVATPSVLKLSDTMHIQREPAQAVAEGGQDYSFFAAM
jgi:hypothetical protein